MTTLSTTLDLDLVVIECGKCGITFGLPKHYQSARRDDHETFYCPNGHGRAYLGKSEAEKLRDQLEAARLRAESWKDQAEASQRSLTAQKGEATKLRKRIANGVCPCCHRTFQNLGRHMAGQHPGYADD